MSKEMKKYIETFNEFLEKRKTMELIVSYDCSDINGTFSANLLNLLKKNYKSEEITMSNYKIGKMLTFSEIDKLKKEIIKLFKESTQITEEKRMKRTIVKLITPIETQFIIDEIINKTE